MGSKSTTSQQYQSMTYKDQVNAALERTLALPTTPAWGPPRA